MNDVKFVSGFCGSFFFSVDDTKMTKALWIIIVAVAWVLCRALHVLRPVPSSGDRIVLMRSVRWRTGDVVLFHSNAFIQSGGDGVWSHVGVVVVGKSGIPRLFEITGGHVYATVAPLQQMLVNEMLQGDRVVAFRRITPAPNEKLLRRYARECMKTRVNYEHVYWRAGFQRFFGSTFPIHCEDEQIGHGSICSSIVADALRSCGALNRVNSFEILPHDFGVADTPKRLPLTNGYQWGPLTFLRMAA